MRAAGALLSLVLMLLVLVLVLLVLMLLLVRRGSATRLTARVAGISDAAGGVKSGSGGGSRVEAVAGGCGGL